MKSDHFLLAVLKYPRDSLLGRAPTRCLMPNLVPLSQWCLAGSTLPQQWQVRRARGPAQSGQGQSLPSENKGGHLSPLPALLPEPLIHSHLSWPFHAPTSDSFQIQWGKLHWKQTITPTVKGRKHCLIAVLHQRQHINPSLTRQFKINKNATPMYTQLSGGTICLRLWSLQGDPCLF